MDAELRLREADPGDAETIAALATLVFLNTYATDGLRRDLAREVFDGYSTAAFEVRLRDKDTVFLLAESAGHLVAFVECVQGSRAPGEVEAQLEVVRLYVHPRFQRRGIGKALLEKAERLAREHGSAGIWLTAWAGNATALAFYAWLGYKVVGTMDHTIEGTSYDNHIFSKRLELTGAATIGARKHGGEN